jgi:hypothetical protein
MAELVKKTLCEGLALAEGEIFISESISAGFDWLAAVHKNLRSSTVGILLCYAEADTDVSKAVSPWMHFEAGWMLRLNKTVVPVCIGSFVKDHLNEHASPMSHLKAVDVAYDTDKNLDFGCLVEELKENSFAKGRSALRWASCGALLGSLVGWSLLSVIPEPRPVILIGIVMLGGVLCILMMVLTHLIENRCHLTGYDVEAQDSVTWGLALLSGIGVLFGGVGLGARLISDDDWWGIGLIAIAVFAARLFFLDAKRMQHNLQL